MKKQKKKVKKIKNRNKKKLKVEKNKRKKNTYQELKEVEEKKPIGQLLGKQRDNDIADMKRRTGDGFVIK